jgi:HAMP domain-containing protein
MLVAVALIVIIMFVMMRGALSSKLDPLFGSAETKGYFVAESLSDAMKPLAQQDMNSLEVQQQLQQTVDAYYLGAYGIYSVAYFMIQDGAGTVLADTFKDVTPASIIEKNTVDGKKHCTPWEDSKKRIYYDCAVPLKLANKSVGAVRAGILQQSSQKPLLQQFKTEHISDVFGGQVLLISVVLIFLIALLLTAAFWYFIIRRLQTLTELTEKMSFGELDVELPMKAHDEIGALEETLERMRVNLKEAIERLKDRLKRRD